MPCRCCHCCCWYCCLQDCWCNVKERPVFMLAVPVITFLVLCSLSVAGVVLGANKFETDQRNAADAAALDWVSINCNSEHRQHQAAARFTSHASVAACSRFHRTISCASHGSAACCGACAMLVLSTVWLATLSPACGCRRSQCYHRLSLQQRQQSLHKKLEMHTWHNALAVHSWPACSCNHCRNPKLLHVHSLLG
jgi:hypothetical protein